MSSIKSILKKHNLRLTRQRISLGELIFSEGNWHFTAEILTDKAQLKNLNISQATVYNVLNDFYDCGLIVKVNHDDERSWFDTNTNHHYHIFNERDGTLTDIESEKVTFSLPRSLKKEKIKKIDILFKI